MYVYNVCMYVAFILAQLGEGYLSWVRDSSVGGEIAQLGGSIAQLGRDSSVEGRYRLVGA